MHHRRPSAEDALWWVRPDLPAAARGHPGEALPVEALVETTRAGRQRDQIPAGEHRAICGLCTTPRAVAEIAAVRRLPLDATRILLADLLAHKLLVTHPQHPGPPSPQVLQRVRDRLQHL